MALQDALLADELKAAVDAAIDGLPPDAAGYSQAFWLAVAQALVAHVLANAQVVGTADLGTGAVTGTVT